MGATEYLIKRCGLLNLLIFGVMIGKRFKQHSKSVLLKVNVGNERGMISVDVVLHLHELSERPESLFYQSHDIKRMLFIDLRSLYLILSLIPDNIDFESHECLQFK